MAEYRLVLNQLGLGLIKPKPFQLPADDLSAGSSAPFEPQIADDIEIVGMSYLGTPIIDNLFLEYEDQFLRLDSVVMSVSMSKNIVKTSINGRKGTVKEYINDGDYTISISGGIYAQNGKYPTDDVRTFIALMQEPAPLKVTSKFLKYFSIHNIVVESYNLPQSEGFTNLQAFEISAISDEPIELLINV